jgi:hypothetical protein
VYLLTKYLACYQSIIAQFEKLARPSHGPSCIQFSFENEFPPACFPLPQDYAKPHLCPARPSLPDVYLTRPEELPLRSQGQSMITYMQTVYSTMFSMQPTPPPTPLHTISSSSLTQNQRTKKYLLEEIPAHILALSEQRPLPNTNLPTQLCANSFPSFTSARLQEISEAFANLKISHPTIKHFPNGVVYLGQIKSRQPHGQGLCIFPDGSYYAGSFYKGYFHCESSETTPDTVYSFICPLSHSGNPKFATYKGSWYLGKRKGEGTVTFSDESTYSGQWHHDTMHGYGTYKFGKNEKYQGDFEFGKRSGNGIYEFPNHHTYNGRFQEDLPDGVGEIRKPSFEAWPTQLKKALQQETQKLIAYPPQLDFTIEQIFTTEKQVLVHICYPDQLSKQERTFKVFFPFTVTPPAQSASFSDFQTHLQHAFKVYQDLLEKNKAKSITLASVYIDPVQQLLEYTEKPVSKASPISRQSSVQKVSAPKSDHLAPFILEELKPDPDLAPFLPIEVPEATGKLSDHANASAKKALQDIKNTSSFDCPTLRPHLSEKWHTRKQLLKAKKSASDTYNPKQREKSEIRTLLNIFPEILAIRQETSWRTPIGIRMRVSSKNYTQLKQELTALGLNPSWGCTLQPGESEICISNPANVQRLFNFCQRRALQQKLSVNLQTLPSIEEYESISPYPVEMTCVHSSLDPLYSFAPTLPTLTNLRNSYVLPVALDQCSEPPQMITGDALLYVISKDASEHKPPQYYRVPMVYLAEICLYTEVLVSGKTIQEHVLKIQAARFAQKEEALLLKESPPLPSSSHSPQLSCVADEPKTFFVSYTLRLKSKTQPLRHIPIRRLNFQEVSLQAEKETQESLSYQHIHLDQDTIHKLKKAAEEAYEHETIALKAKIKDLEKKQKEQIIAYQRITSIQQQKIDPEKSKTLILISKKTQEEITLLTQKLEKLSTQAKKEAFIQRQYAQMLQNEQKKRVYDTAYARLIKQTYQDQDQDQEKEKEDFTVLSSNSPLSVRAAQTPDRELLYYGNFQGGHFYGQGDLFSWTTSDKVFSGPWDQSQVPRPHHQAICEPCLNMHDFKQTTKDLEAAFPLTGTFNEAAFKSHFNKLVTTYLEQTVTLFARQNPVVSFLLTFLEPNVTKKIVGQIFPRTTILTYLRLYLNTNHRGMTDRQKERFCTLYNKLAFHKFDEPGNPPCSTFKAYFCSRQRHIYLLPPPFTIKTAQNCSSSSENQPVGCPYGIIFAYGGPIINLAPNSPVVTKTERKRQNRIRRSSQDTPSSALPSPASPTENTWTLSGQKGSGGTLHLAYGIVATQPKSWDDFGGCGSEAEVCLPKGYGFELLTCANWQDNGKTGSGYVFFPLTIRTKDSLKSQTISFPFKVTWQFKTDKGLQCTTHIEYPEDLSAILDDLPQQLQDDLDEQFAKKMQAPVTQDTEAKPSVKEEVEVEEEEKAPLRRQASRWHNLCAKDILRKVHLKQQPSDQPQLPGQPTHFEAILRGDSLTEEDKDSVFKTVQAEHAQLIDSLFKDPSNPSAPSFLSSVPPSEVKQKLQTRLTMTKITGDPF